MTTALLLTYVVHTPPSANTSYNLITCINQSFNVVISLPRGIATVTTLQSVLLLRESRALKSGGGGGGGSSHYLTEGQLPGNGRQRLAKANS